VIDPARFHEQQFMLFALAWLFRATRDPAVLALAEATFAEDPLAASLERGDGVVPQSGPNAGKQNQYMHLFEALLDIHEATQDPVWLDRARPVLRLLRQRLIDDAGSIRAFARSEGPDAIWREPGHHFRWVWLLHRFSLLTDDWSFLPEVQRIFAFADRFGVARSGALATTVHDAVSVDGAILAGSRLLWAQTEHVKALAAVACIEGSTTRWEEVEASIEAIERLYLRPDRVTFYNQLGPHARPLNPVLSWRNQRGVDLSLPLLMPARLLYHLTLMAVEVGKLRALLGGRTGLGEAGRKD
ncbi:MAG: hypothetical protein DI640_14625, partial [Sphingomonas taxi]